MAINFSGIVGKLAGLGFYSFVLPWLLFFAVILGVLNVMKIFGSNRINAIIAAVIAFFITAFTPAGVTLAAYFTTLFGVGAMTIAVLLLIVLLGGALGYKPDDITSAGGKWAKPLVGLVIIALAVLAFGTATGTDVSIGLPGLDSDTWTVIFILVFVLLAIWYTEEGAGGDGGEKKEAAGGHH